VIDTLRRWRRLERAFEDADRRMLRLLDARFEVTQRNAPGRAVARREDLLNAYAVERTIS
jgi:hypothetical protein